MSFHITKDLIQKFLTKTKTILKYVKRKTKINLTVYSYHHIRKSISILSNLVTLSSSASVKTSKLQLPLKNGYYHLRFIHPPLHSRKTTIPHLHLPISNQTPLISNSVHMLRR